ncbi:hypothetical protein KI387_004888, partial [Taxus chinensis]
LAKSMVILCCRARPQLSSNRFPVGAIFANPKRDTTNPKFLPSLSGYDGTDLGRAGVGHHHLGMVDGFHNGVGTRDKGALVGFKQMHPTPMVASGIDFEGEVGDSSLPLHNEKAIDRLAAGYEDGWDHFLEGRFDHKEMREFTSSPFAV